MRPGSRPRMLDIVYEKGSYFNWNREVTGIIIRRPSLQCNDCVIHGLAATKLWTFLVDESLNDPHDDFGQRVGRSAERERSYFSSP